MVNKVNKKLLIEFHTVYTDFHCLLIALMNKYNFQQYSDKSISATQFNIVDYVMRNGKKTTSELARIFQISTPAISRQTKLLLDNRLITQTRDERDRRIFYIEATAKGKKMVQDSVSLRQFMATEIAQLLTQEELVQFTQLFKKVVAGIPAGE